MHWGRLGIAGVILFAACADAAVDTTPRTTPLLPPSVATTAEVVTFAEVERQVTASTALATGAEQGVQLCGMPIDEMPVASGPRSEPGTAGLLTRANAPDGLAISGDEIELRDGATVADLEIPAGATIRVERNAVVTIERVLAPDAFIFVESGARLTLRDSDITHPLDADSWYVLDGNGSGAMIEHNRLHGGEAATIFLRDDATNWTIRNNDISGGEDGFKPGGSGHVIEHNWIHDLATGTKLSSGAARHSDGLQLQGPNAGLSIRCNFIDASVPGANAAIIVKPDLGDISSIVIEENAMTGGAYTLFSIIEGTGFPLRDVAIVGNVFFAGTGFYGSISVDNDATRLGGNIDEAENPISGG